MDWPFTPYAPELAIRDSLPGLTPVPGSVLNTFLRHLVPAAHCSLRKMINTSLMAACEVPGKWNTPLPSANTGKTHPLRELSANPAAPYAARGERRTGPPPPVSTAGTPPMSACIHATTHDPGRGDACP
ncbi:hypothetical protein TcCL_ESM10156 [Trypanosoma cruzi]|nr:hypothetical protein TcCL_ESM10156 [Trypanosoma cruzi]